MKHYLLLCLVLVVLFFSACKQQGNNIVTYPFQEGRALVGVPNGRGEMAYMIISIQIMRYLRLKSETSCFATALRIDNWLSVKNSNNASCGVYSVT